MCVCVCVYLHVYLFVCMCVSVSLCPVVCVAVVIERVQLSSATNQVASFHSTFSSLGFVFF